MGDVELFKYGLNEMKADLHHNAQIDKSIAAAIEDILSNEARLDRNAVSEFLSREDVQNPTRWKDVFKSKADQGFKKLDDLKGKSLAGIKLEQLISIPEVQN